MPTLIIDPPFIAHRGASALAPENTLAAFLKAKELGATWVEFDVMLTACDEAVVIHDTTLDRTTNGKGNVFDHPYSYIKTLDTGSWFSPTFSAERISTFRDVILFLEQHALSANVEIKAVPGQEQRVVKKILEEIKNYWKPTCIQPLISSFSVEVLRAVRNLSSEAMLGLLIDEWFPEWEPLCHELNCVSVDVNHTILTPQHIEKIKSMGKRILAYTVNDPQRAMALFGMGVDAVFTDNLETMLNLTF